MERGVYQISSLHGRRTAALDKPHSSTSYLMATTTMPHQPSQGVSTATTLALALVLFIALFPDLFHLVWTLPFSLLRSAEPPASSPTLEPCAAAMSWFQKQFTLPAKSRGSYLVTDQVVSALPEIRSYKVGLLNLFVQHTSCALSLNENCRRRPVHRGCVPRS